jgi:S1-C subfamily serine protease
MNRGLVLSATLAALLTACGTGAPRPIRRLDEASQAVVRIEAEGTFALPSVGTVTNVPGSGSGFIIDPTGLIVTNSHVVAGAALIRVWVGSEPNPRSATLLGISECSDLALIDIDGSGFPYLAWSTSDPPTGEQAYAAGYPLGDPRFTLTSGIISKSSADGNVAWAALDDVLEHDATLNPGSSGGPLLGGDAEVMGVNFAASTVATNQYFAIKPSTALPLIELLRSGAQSESIGINGMAFAYPEDDLSGIWVYSVQTDSPAALVGILPGDIILSLESLLLSTDGTMRDYCAVLRSHEPGDALEVEVLRLSTGELLTGVVNGPGLHAVASLTQSPTPTRQWTMPSDAPPGAIDWREARDNLGSYLDTTVTVCGPVIGGAPPDETSRWNGLLWFSCSQCGQPMNVVVPQNVWSQLPASPQAHFRGRSVCATGNMNRDLFGHAFLEVRAASDISLH